MVWMARWMRPVMRNKTPFLYRIYQTLLKMACPSGDGRSSIDLIADFDGGLIHVNSATSLEYHLLFRGCHEPVITDLLKHLVRPGDLCLDIGANVGAHALLMAKQVGSAGKVFAFEPHPRIAHRLRSNVALNRYNQVQVVEAAVSDEDGTATFYGFDPNAFHKGISSLLPDEQTGEQFDVRTISPATLSSEFGITACQFIKLDVEGHEPTVLKALMTLITKSRPAMIFEFRKQHWEKFGGSVEDELDRFRNLNYALYLIRRNVMQPVTDDLPDSCELLCVPK